jgi:hypothetical protein
MAKFPSQRKMLYQTGALSNDTYTVLTSGGVSGVLNLPKDLSLLNKRGYAHTTRKGVPLVFQCQVDFYLHDEDGKGPSLAASGSDPNLGAAETAAGTAFPADVQATLKVNGCQNNWVMRNAAVKFHAARHEMLRKAGVRKAHMGAYAHEIRYNYDGASDTLLVPIDGDGDAFTGGTWDQTVLRTESDTSGFQLKITGTGIDESTGNTATAINIGHAYLQSRAHVAADSNLEASESPAKFSVLNELLRPVATSAVDDDITSDAQGQGDNPPYEVDLDATNSDITEPVELGRAIAGFGNAYGSTIVEIPFGIAELKARVYDAADTNINPSGLVCVTVLDIYEMQG